VCALPACRKKVYSSRSEKLCTCRLCSRAIVSHLCGVNERHAGVGQRLVGLQVFGFARRRSQVVAPVAGAVAPGPGANADGRHLQVCNARGSPSGDTVEQRRNPHVMGPELALSKTYLHWKPFERILGCGRSRKGRVLRLVSLPSGDFHSGSFHPTCRG